jgi:hypothetical protein
MRHTMCCRTARITSLAFVHHPFDREESDEQQLENVAHLVILQTILDHVFESKILVTTIQPRRSFIALYHPL